MSSEASNGSTRAAVGGNASPTIGPEEFPTSSEFAGANASPGDVFGDKSSRSVPSAGQSLSMGLSECYKFDNETPDSLGEGRNDSNGKPMGPQKGSVDNGGAGAKLIWG
jgi:hypothetical protein